MASSGSHLKRILATTPWGNSAPQSNRSPLQQQQSLKSGWLRKQGGVVKSWHRRWFTIKGDQMYYYANEDENKLLGTIFLPGNKVVEYPLNTQEPDKFVFEITPGENRSRMTVTHETYPLAGSTEDERRSWIQAIKKVMYAGIGGAIFGQSLTETMAYESRKANRKVPHIVEMCVEFLLKEGVETEGIFRLPGRSIVIKQLRDEFDSGGRPTLTLPDTDIHSISSLLKLYLRELPEPLIPLQFYESVMRIVNREIHQNPDAAIDRLSTLLTKIPRHNYNLLKYLCHFLREVASHDGINKMSQMNLSTVFLHSIIQPEDTDPALLMGTANARTQVVFLLISSWDRIFRLEYNPHGVGVQVDNLLDIGASSQESFKVDTNMPSSASTGSTNLLDLDLGQEVDPDVILAPFAATTPSAGSTDMQTPPSPTYINLAECASSAGDLLSPQDATPSSEPSSDSKHRRAEMFRRESEEEEEEEDNPIYDIPRTWSGTNSSRGSVLSSGSYHSARNDYVNVPLRSDPPPPPPRERPKPINPTDPPIYLVPRPKNIISQSSEAVPKKSTFYTSVDSNPDMTEGSNSSIGVSTPEGSGVPFRPAPPPPVKHSPLQHVPVQHAMSTDSIDTTDSGTSTTEPDEEDEAIEALVNTDLTGLSQEQLLAHVQNVCSELNTQRSKVKDLISKVARMKDKHKRKLVDMAQKVDAEQSATAEAVNRVMTLQTQLQSYQLKYGFL